MTQRLARRALPAATAAGFVLLWEGLTQFLEVPHYVLPAPSLVLETLIADRAILFPALLQTLKITFLALAAATAGGGGLAVLFSLSPALERAMFPFAVALQVTPIIAIAPLIVLWVPGDVAPLLLCAWIVAFFPVLSNTVIGLRSADRGLEDFFTLYGASRRQRLAMLWMPSALPFFLGGLRIAGGLALTGAIVAEFVLGVSGRSAGLAWRILESSYRLNIPRMFAALVLVAVAGVLVFAVFGWLYRRCLGHWHESARAPARGDSRRQHI